MELLKQARRSLNISYLLLLLALAVGVHIAVPDLFEFKSDPAPAPTIALEAGADGVENGIHVRTGLIDAEGMSLVISKCTSCHSAKIITQNRMTAERWNATIKWMQETQNLQDLGADQEAIVNYLVTNYPPSRSNGRRRMLTDIEWYELER